MSIQLLVVQFVMTITNVYKNFGVSMREERSAKREREVYRIIMNCMASMGIQDIILPP